MQSKLALIWTTRSTLNQLAVLVIVAILLGGCTRERPAATSEVAAGDTSTAPAVIFVTQAPPTPATAPVGGGAEPGVTAEPTQSGDATKQPAEEGTPTPEEESVPTQTQWKVLPGDTLDTIALKFGTDPATIRRLNYLQSDDIRVGQILIVPYFEPTPTPTPEPFKYKVQAGDDLSSLAVRFGTTAEKILEANNMTDPNLITIGQELLIPGYQDGPPADTLSEEAQATATTEAEEEEDDVVRHVVQPGEGLYDIAAKYQIDAAEIAAANGIANPNIIRVGAKLIIPGITQQEAKRLRSVIHVVQSGESLLAIAQQYNVTPEEIAAENNLTDPNSIRVGQELIIPKQ